MADIKAILWDIDDTLLNFAAAEKAAIRACFARFDLGECADDMLARYSHINLGYWEKIERGEIDKRRALVARFEDFFGRGPACRLRRGVQRRVSGAPGRHRCVQPRGL